jgi:hypothetical protein
LHLMRSPRLRFFMGPWIILIIFVAAIMYGGLYFIFKGAQVTAPLTPGGLHMIPAKAASGIMDLKSTLHSPNDIISTTIEFVKKLTDLISSLPALIAAFGVLYAACRKSLIR